MDTDGIVIIAILIVPVVGLFVAWLLLRRNKTKKFATSIVLLVLFFALASLLSALLERALRDNSSAFEWPLFLIVDITSTIVALLLAFRLFGSHIFGSEGAVDYADPNALRNAITKILDSDSFLTALRSTLPQGEEDQKFGLDYIPFMLNSIDDRRKRAVKSARLFLITTVGAALLFSGVVMYFGYILVNEAAAGTGKAIAELKRSTQSISDSLQLVTPNYFRNLQFEREVAPSIEKLTENDAGDKNKEVQETISKAVQEARKTRACLALLTS